MSSLAEFFLMSEGRETRYTLEPESNGQGRLLAWEEVSYAGEDADHISQDTSYEVLAHGDFDRLADALVARLGEEQLSSGTGDFAQLRDLWDSAIESGEAVVVEPALADGSRLAMGLTAKSGRGAVEGDSYGFEDL